MRMTTASRPGGGSGGVGGVCALGLAVLFQLACSAAADGLPNLLPPAPARAAETPDADLPPLDDPPAAAIDAGAPLTWWRPTVGMTWDWQLQTPHDFDYDVQVFDIDLFDSDPSLITKLHARGRKVICYVNLGAWENWRPDKELFPPEVIGAQWPDFPREYWLDIRQWTQLAPVVGARLDMAVAKGCDGIEPDNMDGWNTAAHNPSGFPLTPDDQLVYNRHVAQAAHQRGLGIGLKNDTPQAAALSDDFDYHVSEQCFEFNQCQDLMSFVQKGKPIFEAEYDLTLPMFCPQAKALRISAIRKKDASLSAWREVCP
jgi:hypothetical protein